jgi:hypothetical protein
LCLSLTSPTPVCPWLLSVPYTRAALVVVAVLPLRFPFSATARRIVFSITFMTPPVAACLYEGSGRTNLYRSQ